MRARLSDRENKRVHVRETRVQRKTRAHRVPGKQKRSERSVGSFPVLVQREKSLVFGGSDGSGQKKEEEESLVFFGELRGFFKKKKQNREWGLVEEESESTRFLRELRRVGWSWARERNRRRARGRARAFREETKSVHARGLLSSPVLASPNDSQPALSLARSSLSRCPHLR